VPQILSILFANWVHWYEYLFVEMNRYISFCSFLVWTRARMFRYFPDYKLTVFGTWRLRRYLFSLVSIWELWDSLWPKELEELFHIYLRDQPYGTLMFSVFQRFSNLLILVTNCLLFYILDVTAVMFEF
jgi:hypothetical protein